MIAAYLKHPPVFMPGDVYIDESAVVKSYYFFLLFFFLPSFFLSFFLPLLFFFAIAVSFLIPLHENNPSGEPGAVRVPRAVVRAAHRLYQYLLAAGSRGWFCVTWSVSAEFQVFLAGGGAG